MAASRFFKPFLGVEGGVILKGSYFRQLGEKSPLFKKVNNALFLAPAFKWGLAITPLYGVIIGVPKPENIDLNQSAALAFTGIVWSYYGFLVTPRADLLIAVNAALLAVNGYNVTRKLRWDAANKRAAATSSSTSTAVAVPPGFNAAGIASKKA